MIKTNYIDQTIINVGNYLEVFLNHFQTILLFCLKYLDPYKQDLRRRFKTMVIFIIVNKYTFILVLTNIYLNTCTAWAKTWFTKL